MKEEIINLLLTYKNLELLDDKILIAKKINKKILELGLKENELIFPFKMNGELTYIEIIRNEIPLERKRDLQEGKYIFVNVLNEY